ncbi:hypothetical protein [Variovorax ginsengisoli]|uniref:Uncharacterized protein n=1 Tax=Variovorax ginsengisoli TaxID=363844 RepID=A0ABT8SFT4_9BURK|nr:hypothetical protein [Variovorax ginsengisoli]MDN8618029.1 hypothetical protein [Variovorax ginsengisoli]MDO1537199.1 hypothetical protein [Variovorax ginsengisoli]
MKDYLTPSDFMEFPLWRYDEDADGYFPVRGEADLPGRVRDLSLRAEFTTPAGNVFEGYIVGVENVFSIGLFGNERIYHFNKNLSDLSREQAEEFLAASGLSGKLHYEAMFPLRYETKWGSPLFNDFSGVFEMPG